MLTLVLTTFNTRGSGTAVRLSYGIDHITLIQLYVSSVWQM